MPNPCVPLRCDQIIPVNKVVNKKEQLQKGQEKEEEDKRINIVLAILSSDDKVDWSSARLQNFQCLGLVFFLWIKEFQQVIKQWGECLCNL
jgi:hypothetical protein